ncbi:hypothetical protein [Neobacillus sp. SAB-20_R2A]|uniref:hypothetical protein n=1 Tax=Neobacillus sp. SAB-20_R2A TaxID=3120519 RepID=UPI003C6DE636
MMQIFSGKFTKQQGHKKISELEKRIAVLKAAIQEFKQETESTKPNVKNVNLNWHNLNKSLIEKLTVGKQDSTINFGQLDINELSGHLTVGTSYEGDFSEEIRAKIKEKLEKKGIKDAKV